jgi:hypothetical protein
MAFTYQEVADLARKPLNDEDKARYSDSDLMLYANSAILALYLRRPDLFIGQYGNLPGGNSALTDSAPLPDAYKTLLADYVTGRISMTDDEFANSGKAAMFFQLLGPEIT